MAEKWLAVYDPKWGSWKHPEFDTEKEAEDYIKTRLCKPNCESCDAEWHTCLKSKFDKAETFGQYLTDGLGMKVVYRSKDAPEDY